MRRKCLSPQAHHGDDDDDGQEVTFEEGGLKTSFDFFKIPGKTSESLLRLMRIMMTMMMAAMMMTAMMMMTTLISRSEVKL